MKGSFNKKNCFLLPLRVPCILFCNFSPIEHWMQIFGIMIQVKCKNSKCLSVLIQNEVFVMIQVKHFIEILCFNLKISYNIILKEEAQKNRRKEIYYLRTTKALTGFMTTVLTQKRLFLFFCSFFASLFFA